MKAYQETDVYLGTYRNFDVKKMESVPSLYGAKGDTLPVCKPFSLRESERDVCPCVFSSAVNMNYQWIGTKYGVFEKLK